MIERDGCQKVKNSIALEHVLKAQTFFLFLSLKKKKRF